MSNRSLGATFAVTLLVCILMQPAHAGFTVTNLVTDDQAANPAQITDPDLKNAWGISTSATSPFWVSDNGTGKSTLYHVDPATGATTKMGLVVTIPNAGNVTGQVFSGISGSFNGDSFLFVSEDGTISGWRGALGTTAEVLQTPQPGNVYKGTTEITTGGHSYLLSANFGTGNIDVLKDDISAPDLAGKFTDPALPAGYAPFNIQVLNGTIYVTYALQDSNMTDDVPGAGHGFVSAFDLQGSFLGRVASQGVLNSPWGLAIAPASFGAIAGDLLVGNFGDGQINVFDLSSNSFAGSLKDTIGNPLVIDGLWGLIPGNGGSAGNPDRIYFSAGPDGEQHGLFGVISGSTTTAVPEPGSIVLALIGAAFMCLRMRRRATP